MVSQPLSILRKNAAFAGIMLVNFMTMFLICGVGVYGYAIAGAYDSVAQVGMIFTLESVARCVAIPLSGKLSDRVGRKQLFLFALALYIAAYAVAAFSTGFWMFTISRTVSGFGWGLFVSTIFVLISDIFGQNDAPRFSGLAQSLSTVAMIVGAPIAGVLCGFTWRLEFYVALPILIVGFLLCAVALPAAPRSEGSAGGQMDVGGCIATFVTLVPFSLAMNWGNTYGWRSPLVLALLGVTVVGILLLVLVERRAVNPIYPAKLLGNKFYLAIFMVSLFYSVGNAASNYAPSYAQYVLGASSALSGLISLPSLIIAAVLTALLGSYAAKHSRYKGMTMIWAFATLATGILFLFLGRAAAVGGTFGLALLIVASTPMGAVNGAQQIVPYTYPMKVLKPEELAGGMAFMGLGGVLGNTISSGVCGALMNTAGGLATVFYVPIVCAVVMLLFAFLFRDIREGETI